MELDEQAAFDLLHGVVKQAHRDAKHGDEQAAQWLAELDPRGDDLGRRLGFNPAMLRAHAAAQPSGRDKRRRDLADRLGVMEQYLPADFDTEG